MAETFIGLEYRAFPGKDARAMGSQSSRKKRKGGRDAVGHGTPIDQATRPNASPKAAESK